MADIALDRAQAVASDLERSSGSHLVPAVLDVTSPSSIEEVVAFTIAGYGRIDILINCAGFPIDRPLVKMDDDAWRQVLDVCLYGTFAMCRAVAPGMIDRQYGRIIDLVSGLLGKSRSGQLFRREGRCYRLDQVDRQGTGTPRHYRQHDRSSG